MKKYNILLIVLSVIVVLLGTVLYTKIPQAVAAKFKTRILPNEVATGSNATSTASGLRYVDNGATTTYIADIIDAQKIALAIKGRSSTTPATIQVRVEYGIKITNPVNPLLDPLVEWFDPLTPVSGPELGFNTSTSTQNAAITSFASSTPLNWAYITSAATSSGILQVKAIPADKVRFSVSMVGSAGVFWLSPIIKDEIQ